MTSEVRITNQHSYLYRNQIKIEIQTTFKALDQINRILEQNKGDILKFWDSWFKKKRKKGLNFSSFQTEVWFSDGMARYLHWHWATEITGF